MDEYLDGLLKRNLCRNDFYRELWSCIAQNEIFDTHKAKVIALFDCAIDKRLPYYYIDQADALKMSQETYVKYMDSIGEAKFGKMKYILNGLRKLNRPLY